MYPCFDVEKLITFSTGDLLPVLESMPSTDIPFLKGLKGALSSPERLSLRPMSLDVLRFERCANFTFLRGFAISTQIVEREGQEVKKRKKIEV